MDLFQTCGSRDPFPPAFFFFFSLSFYIAFLFVAVVLYHVLCYGPRFHSLPWLGIVACLMWPNHEATSLLQSRKQTICFFHFHLSNTFEAYTELFIRGVVFNGLWKSWLIPFCCLPCLWLQIQPRDCFGYLNSLPFLHSSIYQYLRMPCFLQAAAYYVMIGTEQPQSRTSAAIIGAV